MINTNTKYVNTCKSISELSGWVAISLGLIAIAGWTIDIAALKSILPSVVAMKVNTAIAFILLGTSLILLRKNHSGKKWLAGKLLASIVLIIGLLTLLEYVLNLNFSIDHFLFTEDAGAILTTYPGRMSAYTAINFILISFGLLFYKAKIGKHILLNQVFALITLIIALVSLIAYIYEKWDVFQPLKDSIMALHTSVLFFILAMGLLCAKPTEGFMLKFNSETLSGWLLRYLIPFTIVIPILIEIISMLGVKFGLYNESFVAVVNAIGIILTLCVLVWFIVSKFEKVEEKLEESRNIFKIVFENSLHGNSITGVDGSLRVNKAFCEILGYTEKELNSKTWEEITHPDDIQESIDRIESLKNGKESAVKFEKRYIHKNENIVWADISATLLRDRHNMPLFFITSISDITERRNKEMTIHSKFRFEKMKGEISRSFVGIESENFDANLILQLEKMANFAGANRSSLFHISAELDTLTNTHEWCEDPKDSQIHELQKIPFSTFGWHKDELLKQNIISISSIDDYPEEAKGERAWVLKHGFRSLLFIPLVNKKEVIGTIGFYGEIGKEIIWRQELKDMLNSVGILITTIQERLKAEEHLIENENLLLDSQKVAQLGSYTFDITSGTWKSSKMLDDIFGIDNTYPKDLTGWLQIVHPDDYHMMKDYIENNVLANKNSFNKEYRIKKINSQKVDWVHGIGALEFDKNGKLVKMIGTIQDITKRKKAKEKLKIKSTQLENQLRKSEEQRMATLSVLSDLNQTTKELSKSEQLTRSITQTAAEAIISVNEEGVIFSWNEAAEKIFGYAVSETINMDISKIISKNLLDVHKSDIRLMKNGHGGKPFGKTTELIGYHKDQNEFPIEISLSGWVVENKNYYTAIIRDITQRKLHERKLLRQNELLLEYAFINSHKVRAHVATCMGLLNIMAIASIGSQEKSEIEEKLNREIINMEALIHELSIKFYEIDNLELPEVGVD